MMEKMQLPTPEGWMAAPDAYALLKGYLFSTAMLWQVAALLVVLGIAHFLAEPIRKRLNNLEPDASRRWMIWLTRRLDPIVYPACALLAMALALVFFTSIGLKVTFLSIITNLTAAWVAIRFTSSFVENKSMARWIALLAWGIAALNIIGKLDPVLTGMDSFGFTLGKTRLSLLIAAKGLLTLTGLLWLATVVAGITEKRLSSVTTLTPSLRVLIAKFTRILLIALAILVALNTFGIDLTSLTVFSGAVGVGLGFGLQKVVSNFISGIILLLDRSIKPGDVIYIRDTDTYGWVNRLGGRCVSVLTRDGKEHLIPNESLITEKVENWSYSSRDVRLKIPVGISYESDPNKALAIMLEIAGQCTRVLRQPEPNALVCRFSDSAIDLELRCWINDPVNGIGNITSMLLLEIWKRFQENNIAFPYPQRDLHIREGSVLEVRQAEIKAVI